MSFYWLLIIPVLGVVITIHELGHYFAARWLGVRVLEFGFGLPPRIFAVRRGGIEYSFNWIPAGGFVKILGENGDSDAADSFARAGAWKRIMILVAGPLMNVVLALLIFAGISVSGVREVDAPLTGVLSVTAGQPAAAGGMRPGDHILKVGGVPVSSSEEIHERSYANAGRPTEFVVERDGRHVSLTISPNAGQPYLGIYFQYWVSPVKVVNLEAGSAADKAGLRLGDEITRVNDTPVNNLPLLIHLVDNNTAATNLTVRRDGEEVGPVTLDVQSGPRKAHLLGLLRPYRVVHNNPFSSLGESIAGTWDVIIHVPGLIVQAFTHDSKNFHLAGPLGIGQSVGEATQENGVEGLLTFVALLSVSLSLINLLPLPALDGGRLLFILIELLRGGRRLAPGREIALNAVFMSALFLFLIFITVFDALRLMQGGRMLR